MSTACLSGFALREDPCSCILLGFAQWLLKVLHNGDADFVPEITCPSQNHKPTHSCRKLNFVHLPPCRSGNPRNNPRLGGTFLEVQRYSPGNDSWAVVHTDDDACTRFKWERPNKLSTESKVTVFWDIPLDAVSGKYVIMHYGDWKSVLGEVTSYHGASKEFYVR